jgi:hypothetical protein
VLNIVPLGSVVSELQSAITDLRVAGPDEASRPANGPVAETSGAAGTAPASAGHGA